METPSGEFEEAAASVRAQADEQMQVSDEVREAVRNMEEQYESIAGDAGAGDSELPSVSDILEDVERFLSDDEIRRLSARLAAHEARWPQQAALVRLLLLTGCRKGELLTLQWPDYRDGHLFLRDSKTGPRTVWLSEPARAVLDGLERKGRWVFPTSEADRPRSANWLEYFWTGARAEAELEDVRLHDLRHTIASLALRQGETVLAIGRLLGHRNTETTLKYIHLADAMVQEAAESIGAALEGK